MRPIRSATAGCRKSDHSVELYDLEVAVKPVLGTFGAVWRVGVLLHYIAVGPRRPQPEPQEKETVHGNGDDRFDEKARRTFDSIGRTEVHRGELLRHPVYTRLLHWAVALFFFLALFTGFGIYLPWLFRWFTPFFGGGPLSRILHPYFGVGFVFFFFLQMLNWLAPMLWSPGDTKWIGNIRRVVSGEETLDHRPRPDSSTPARKRCSGRS